MGARMDVWKTAGWIVSDTPSDLLGIRNVLARFESRRSACRAKPDAGVEVCVENVHGQVHQYVGYGDE